MSIKVDLAKIIDPTMAQTMVAELEEGGSLSKASMYITTREYRREDFVALRKAHGDMLTTLTIAQIAYSA